MTLSSGTYIGRYELRDLLGAGGMGEVYRARDHDLEREVAVKILREGEGESGDRQRRFIQEAKAASGLHHPNIGHVYEIGSHDNFRFIAMELVEGETLRKRLTRGRMSIDETLEIATQIASALACAHKAGIVHRDIKPENIIVTPEGYAKVVDFGLAKLREIREDAATIVKTSPGLAVGTLGYMAPEQLVGGEITPAADVFALGIVIYEMIGGRRPFEGTTSTEVISAILSKSPRPLHDARPEIPPKLEAVIHKALAKDPGERHRDASEIHDQLKEISRAHAIAPEPKRPRGIPLVAIGGVLLAVLIGAGVWAMLRQNNRRAALQSIDVAEKLMKEQKLVEAYEVASAAALVLPNDDRVRDVIAITSGRVTIESQPAGATVFLQRYKGPAERVRMGVTPFTIPRLPRADYLLTLEKPGYSTAVRSISTLPFVMRGEILGGETPTFEVKMAQVSDAPPGMVLVEGGPYRLLSYYRPSDRSVELRDFFIDRFEVTNRDFEQFIGEGGYRRRELWKHPFVDQGKTVSFEQAMARFRDKTGLPAPRGWSGGAPPAGRENYPVTDVTWYEAAAFAEWKGKKLPTIYQWEKAGRHVGDAALNALPWGLMHEGFDATERANFLGDGTMPVDTMPFGVSPYGAHHMAGNVSEWCRNEHPPGHAARGGAWNDAVYAFGQTAALPSFYSAPTLGFRCAIGGGGDEGDFALNPKGFVPVYKPVDDRTFAEFRRRYEYKPEPLNARVIETVDTPYWTREKITFTAAGKTVPAYLYLPKGFRRPLQVIQFAPAGDVVGGHRTLSRSIESLLAALIRGGRAVISVELEGFLGRPRPPGWIRPDFGQEEYVDFNVTRVNEMRRALDYLETRPDIDRTRIGLFGISAGGGPGIFASALESRYRSVAFLGTGIPTITERFAPAANRVHFVPRIRAPKLMLAGRYDEDTSLKSETEPMFQLLSEPKRLEIYEGGHIAPAEIGIPTIRKWFDETMGVVEQ